MSGLEAGQTAEVASQVNPIANIAEIYSAVVEGRTPALSNEALDQTSQFLVGVQKAIELVKNFREEAAEIVGGSVVALVDVEAVVNEPAEDTSEKAQVPASAPVDNPNKGSDASGEATNRLEELNLSSEATFILNALRDYDSDEAVGRSFFDEKGFSRVEDRLSKAAYNQAYVKAINELINAGLVKRQERGAYILVKDSPFLA